MKLSVLSWHGEKPVAGDELQTRTGRRYQILEVKEKALHCMVLPADEPVKGKVYFWEWASRKRKRRAM